MESCSQSIDVGHSFVGKFPDPVRFLKPGTLSSLIGAVRSLPGMMDNRRNDRSESQRCRTDRNVTWAHRRRVMMG
jgi:hypothetical protein